MSTLTFFFIFVCIVAVLFLAINLLLAPSNPYSEKISAFECGFHSYLQTRLPFDISFFIYALLFLLFDLEILLLYPFVVSSYVNNIYGLIVMLIFSFVITIGFIFEIGRGALHISSRQNWQHNTPNKTIETMSFIGSKEVKRYYSTKRTSESREIELEAEDEKVKSFMRQAYDAMKGINLDSNNPFVIASSFLKNYPTVETSKSNITFSLLCSILYPQVETLKITELDFKVLLSIRPVRFSLPIAKEGQGDFFEVVGDRQGKGENVKAGVYKFINKSNDFSYIGSSAQLADRLMHAYLGNRIGKRKIELALQEFKLESFYLEVYILPDNLVEGKTNSEIKELTLFLEQFYILLYNPEYNVLKVAGSTVGRIFSEESRDKMRLAALARDIRGENNPMFGLSHSKETREILSKQKLGRILSEDVKAKISAALSGENHPRYGKTHTQESIEQNMLSQDSRQEIEVLDLETNIKTVYPSKRAAARALEISSATIDGYFRYTPKNSEKKPCKGRYVLTIVPS